MPVLVCMGAIFLGSSDTNSFQHSSRILGPLVHWLMPHLPQHEVEQVVLVLRKVGHLTEYAILALLAWRALSHRHDPYERGWRWADAGRALLLAFAYAISDEFHQKFVPSRQASVTDVLIDTTGALLALLFLYGIGRWRKLW
jgi:VanZ family protein